MRVNNHVMDASHFRYFAGLYTCILPVMGGWSMVYLLFRDGRRSDVEIVSK